MRISGYGYYIGEPALPWAFANSPAFVQNDQGFLEFRSLTSQWLLAIHIQSFSGKNWFLTKNWPLAIEFHWRSINSSPNMKQEREGKWRIKNKKNYQQRNKKGKVKKQSEIAHGFTK